MSKRWYVVHAYSGFENQVKRALEERIDREAMEDKFGEILIPTEEVIEMRGGQKRRSERKFFPGYVLVQIEANTEGKAPRIDDECWHLIKDTPKVLGFIGGTADKPLPIRDSEAEAILSRVREGVEKPKPKVLFEPGEMVRVTEGPFNDFNGVVEEVNYEKSRLRVAVLIFGRSTPVELEFSQVEKAGRIGRRAAGLRSCRCPASRDWKERSRRRIHGLFTLDRAGACAPEHGRLEAIGLYAVLARHLLCTRSISTLRGSRPDFLGLACLHFLGPHEACLPSLHGMVNSEEPQGARTREEIPWQRKSLATSNCRSRPVRPIRRHRSVRLSGNVV